jgi:hypothetical protein
MWLELCINLTLSLLQTTYLTNGEWKEWNAEIEIHVLIWSIYFLQPSSRMLKDSTHALQVNWILLSRDSAFGFHEKYAYQSEY